VFGSLIFRIPLVTVRVQPFFNIFGSNVFLCPSLKLPSAISAPNSDTRIFNRALIQPEKEHLKKQETHLSEVHLRTLVILALESKRVNPTLHNSWQGAVDDGTLTARSTSLGSQCCYISRCEDQEFIIRGYTYIDDFGRNTVDEIHRLIQGQYNYRGYKYAITRTELLDEEVTKGNRFTVAAAYQLVTAPNQVFPTSLEVETSRQSLEDYWKSSKYIFDDDDNADDFRSFRDLARNWNSRD
jgi:hypothetical protein